MREHTFRSIARITGGALTIGLTILACGRREHDNMDSANAAMAPAAAMRDSTPNPALTDAQIVQIAMVANANDSAGGVLASSKATAADVKSFARTMVRDHGMLNKKLEALAIELSLTPDSSEASMRMAADGAASAARLQSLSSSEFDSAYMDQEVSAHERVLSDLKETLIPAAQNSELKSLLQQASDAVDGHLQRARTVQQAHRTAAQ